MKLRKPLSERFKDRAAIVTGGASGIGRAVVEELCREGASVAFVDLSESGGALAESLSQAGHDVLFFRGDVADQEFCRASVSTALQCFGRIDYVVNNAFSFLSKGLDVTREDWKRTFQVGPEAFALLAQLTADCMRAQGGGAIVNVSSISAFIAQPHRWTYNAAKGAVHTLTKCMALDLAPYGIRVNSVSPGWIWTQEVDKAAAGDRARWEPVWGQYHMLERCGEPVEVAAAILFLLSDDASFITGADLPVDGGYQSLGSEGIGKSSKFAGSH
ncbi:MAG: glucose 1-dehydrogenase [Bryobacterales bacterium]|nr:glucose 1-dehydrogenase [Bryobacterales bacterium]